MNTFRNLHPLTLLCYFAFMIVFSVFNFNPIYLALSLFGAVMYAAVIQGAGVVLRSFVGYFAMFLLIAVTNPLFSHNGATALFFINDNRVTLEALVYGAVLGLAIVAALYWFRSFNEVFDSEKYRFIFGRISPGLGLVFSMILRFVPELVRSFRDIKSAQRAFGSNQGRVKRYLGSFSAVITQSLENGVITSDSMNARGFGLKHRGLYSRFRFTLYDGVYLGVAAVLFSIACIGARGFEYYPYIKPMEFSAMSILSVCAFGALSLIPFIFEVKEGIKWRISVSRI